MNKNLNEKIGFGVFVECLYVKEQGALRRIMH